MPLSSLHENNLQGAVTKQPFFATYRHDASKQYFIIHSQNTFTKMKKAIFLIVAALMLCGRINAQEMALTSTTQNEITQLSILETPMPISDFSTHYQFGEQQYASPRTGWGIACIISGGLTMVSGLTVWLGGDTFNKVTTSVPSGFEPDPDFQQAAGTVSKGIKTAGIIGTVIGAGLVATGIVLVSGDKGSGSRRHKHRRYSENLLAPEPYAGEWTLSLNAGPTCGGLSLNF